MSVWLGSWDGDNAGAVVGRQSNRLLVNLTRTADSTVTGLDKFFEFLGTNWYHNIKVVPLAPGVHPAIVTSLDWIGDNQTTASLEIAEMNWGDRANAWKAGVNLFSVSVSFIGLSGYNAPINAWGTASCIASAIIDADLKKLSMPFAGMGWLAGAQFPG